MNDLKTQKNYFRGCLVGGACGDAMGYPVETMDWNQIRSEYGAHGITEFPIHEERKVALFSDDTQMNIMTVDGLLWADKKAKERGVYAYTSSLFYCYQKWLYTQTGKFADKNYEFLLGGEILENKELFARRTPDKVNLATLEGCINGKYGTMKRPMNQNPGTGAVMRAAPIGLYFYTDAKMAFRIGAESAAITHGHPDAYLPAGFLACLIAQLIRGKDLESAIVRCLKELETWPDHENTRDLVEKARSLAAQMNRTGDLLNVSELEMANRIDLAAIGSGETGSEAIALAIYCALRYSNDFEQAILLAVNQGGNSDTVAAICGAILGTSLGLDEIPYSWVNRIECSILLVHGADKLLESVL